MVQTAALVKRSRQAGSGRARLRCDLRAKEAAGNPLMRSPVLGMRVQVRALRSNWLSPGQTPQGRGLGIVPVCLTVGAAGELVFDAPCGIRPSEGFRHLGTVRPLRRDEDQDRPVDGHRGQCIVRGKAVKVNQTPLSAMPEPGVYFASPDRGGFGPAVGFPARSHTLRSSLADVRHPFRVFRRDAQPWSARCLIGSELRCERSSS